MLVVSVPVFLPGLPGSAISERDSFHAGKATFLILLCFGSFGPAYTRAAVLGLTFASGNCAGIISSNVYPSRTAPRLFEGHSVSIGFEVMSIVCAVILTVANRIENTRRDVLYGPVAADGSDANPNKILTPEQRQKWGLEGLSRLEIIELGDKHPGMDS